MTHRFDPLAWANLYYAFRGWKELLLPIEAVQSEMYELMVKAEACDYCGIDYVRDQIFCLDGLWEVKNRKTGLVKKLCLSCMQHHCCINSAVNDTEPDPWGRAKVR